MTNRPALLRQIHTEARPYVEQLVELNVVFTGFRKLATDNGLDWGQIKALLRAEIEDGEEGGSEKVDRIIKKAEYAGEYAALLGLGTSNMNGRNSISADLPPHDEDGVIIEPASAPSDAEAGEVTAADMVRAFNAWTPPHDPTTGELIDDVPATGPATAPAPGAGGDTITAKGDVARASGRFGGDASPTNSDIHREPSNRDVSADGKASSAAASQGQAAHAGTGSETLASHEGDTQGEGAPVLSPISPQSVALALPVVTDAPEAPASPMSVEASGDPIPCEANGWAGLEPLPQFDRRRISEAAA